MSLKPLLYSYWRSSCSYRVRIALQLKNITDYDYKPIHLVKSQQRDEEFLAINPMGQVPALLIDGILLTQSVAILEYLDETRPEPPILPRDPKDRAQVRKLVEIIASGIQPVQNLSVLNRIASIDKENPKSRQVWALWVIEQGFTALEVELVKTAGKYCFGNEISMADICLAPQIYNAKRFQIDFGPFPTIARIEQELSQLPAFTAAHPDNQPDAEK